MCRVGSVGSLKECGLVWVWPWAEQVTASPGPRGKQAAGWARHRNGRPSRTCEAGPAPGVDDGVRFSDGRLEPDLNRVLACWVACRSENKSRGCDRHRSGLLAQPKPVRGSDADPFSHQRSAATDRFLLRVDVGMCNLHSKGIGLTVCMQEGVRPRRSPLPNRQRLSRRVL